MVKSLQIALVLLAAVALIFSKAAAQSAAQSTPTGTASIAGMVKLGEAPAAGITLALIPEQGARPGGAPQRQNDPQLKILQATTDDKGQYQFANVAAGRFRVALLTETLVPAGSSQRSSGVAVSVSDGQAVTQINFALAPGGVITGRVTDHQGRPVIAERLNLMTLNAAGQPQPFNGGNRQGAETDDRGVFRIYGLPEGKYLVSAGTENNRPGANRRIRYPRTFYPDAVEAAQAQLVEVASGGVAEGINIRMGAPMKTYAVTGRAVDADTGEPILGVPINVGAQRGPQGRGGGGPPNPNNSSSTNDKGEFRVTGLLSGRYSISVQQAELQSPDSANLSSNYYNDPANFEITDSDTSGVEVKVHRGATISGTVVVEGAANTALPQLMISATSRGQQGQQGQRGQGGQGGGRQSAAMVGPSGAFTISGLAAGSVRLNVNDFGGGRGGGSGLSLVRIERNGAAINGDFEIVSGQQVTGIRVVVGYGTGVIQGKVILAGGAIPPGTQLMVTARSLNSAAGGGQNRPAQVDAGGNFRIEGLYSGSYEVRVIAVTPNLAGGQVQAGQGRGGQRGGGGNQPRVRIPNATQTVTVTNGAVAQVNLNLDLSQQ
ncbi:MAG TPA: carboxypeptidase-like regulatory domain-containing protein [Blastocatellia bacterium]|nr:carboxypeptidase-like regulatory domain-containing protein [Blastocatellia bacterium]HMX25013.1 carboxypeptidase-like regulatory domain-containing protein [Blastocatellia bacterium]HMY75790.1 carboxypeptidase-like regulatory domain-containing protein [Blastocatellia bacterium]HMZ20976.1 carboxypeptidase-like regulatory domain-containing protein [Blastocatellia bacterium]HNG31336.1 carboxypeptidase-like regulatory domain-containing protein [Blastocatellia bacterium]